MLDWSYNYQDKPYVSKLYQNNNRPEEIKEEEEGGVVVVVEEEEVEEESYNLILQSQTHTHTPVSYTHLTLPTNHRV